MEERKRKWGPPIYSRHLHTKERRESKMGKGGSSLKYVCVKPKIVVECLQEKAVYFEVEGGKQP